MSCICDKPERYDRVGCDVVSGDWRMSVFDDSGLKGISIWMLKDDGVPKNVLFPASYCPICGKEL